jgi:CO dehydrogenase maturation factor
MCRTHATVRSLLKEIVAGSDRLTITDMEAGLEHFSRGTTRHADVTLVVIEPYFKSMETAARIDALAKELGVKNVYAVANKVRDSMDERAIKEFCERRGMALLATVPFDEAILEADRAGLAPMDNNPASRSVAEITRIAEQLLRT